ncbi:MAG TPA: response regulator [Armatimonadota bacterium]|jgi:two-component system chemotaxis response regulator CheY
MKMLKAMVIDDSRIMRTMVMNALKRSGLAEFEFIEAEDGQDALEKFDPKEIDIIFADWNMPRLSGIDFVRKIRANKKNNGIPILMVTSEQTVGKMSEALGRAGATAYITKPFTDADLHRRLAKIVDELPDHAAKPQGGFFSRLVGS